MKGYRAILFDADDTLLDFQSAEREAVRSALSRMGIICTDALLKRYSQINRSLWDALERGELSREEIWDRRFPLLLRPFGREEEGAETERLYRLSLGRQGMTVPGAGELLASLSGRYMLYIVTNGSAQTQYTRIEASGLRAYVEDVFVSEEIGATKPDPAFFDAVFRSIPFDREEVLMVGDSLASDIQGGRSAGIDTCWFNPCGKNGSDGIRPTFEIRELKDLTAILKEMEVSAF